jgi:hypothetical protein
MSSDATTLPLPDTLPAGARRRTGRIVRRRPDVRSASDERTRASTWPAYLALVTIPLCSALIVVMAADRPSLLVATSHTNFFPHWMAGPLGGLWPGLTRDQTALRYLFSGSLVVAYVAYLFALRGAPRLRARWVVASILAVHAIFLISPPLALTDIFNYLNYGRMEVLHHLNPYTTIPVSGPHTDPSYGLSNWHQLLSPYGPLFTLLTFAFVPLGVAASFWSLKALLVVTSLATLRLIWKCALLLGRDPVTAVVLVGLNPIVLVWGLGADHNDFLMMFLIVLAFYLLLCARARREAGAAAGADGKLDPAAQLLASAQLRSADGASRAGARPRGDWRTLVFPLDRFEIAAGAALIGAASIKASGAVIIPVVLAWLLRARRSLVQVVLGMSVACAAIGAASLIAFGLHVPDLSTQSRLITNFSIPNLTGLALGAGGETATLHTIFGALLLGAIALCCVHAFRRHSPIAASGWASVALLVSLGWALPWYVLWVLPLAALASSVWLRRVALLLGAYLIVAWAPASGQLWRLIGFHPEKTTLGRLHQRVVRELLY